MHAINSIGPKTMFGSVLEHYATLLQGNQCKTCVSVQNVQFRGTELAGKVSLRTHPIYSIRPTMMFRSVSEHYTTLLQENQCKTCVSVQNVQFRGTELAGKFSLRTHPIYSIRLKTMFGSISEHVATLLHAIQCKTCASGQNVRFRLTELAKKVSLRTLLIYFIRHKTMFGSVSEHVAQIRRASCRERV